MRLFLELKALLRRIIIILNITARCDKRMARARDHDIIVFSQKEHVLTAQTISIDVADSVVVSGRSCGAALL